MLTPIHDISSVQVTAAVDFVQLFLSQVSVPDVQVTEPSAHAVSDLAGVAIPPSTN